MRAVRSIFPVVLAVLLAHCGGGHSGGGSAPPPTPPPVQQPTVLSGSGSAVAAGVLGTTTALPAAAADLSNGYLLSRLIVLLAPNATVDQLNAAARQVNATRIVTSRNGFPLLTLEVPRQTSIAALRALAKTLKSQPGIAAAFAARTMKPAMLPASSPGQQLPFTYKHLLATRFPQAWNAHTADGASCTSSQRLVPVYVVDYFNSTDDTALGFLSHPPIFDGTPAGADESKHGAKVSLLVGALFDDFAPTGASPFAHCVQIHAVDDELDDAFTSASRLSEAVENQAGNFIINMSMEFDDPFICGVSGADQCTSANSRVLEAGDVQEEIFERLLFADVFGALLKPHADHMLIVTSAGNVQDRLDVGGSSFFALRYAGFRDARFSTPFALATHLGELSALLQDQSLWTNTEFALANATFSQARVDLIVASLQNLGFGQLDRSNVLVADSGTPAESPDAVTPSTFDFLGADIRAVGDDIRLASDTIDSPFSGSGTSYAAPQVAGLAAYLWSVSGELANAAPSETRAHILRMARAPAGLGLLGVPLLDAYAATLAVDKPGGTKKVRRALVDANDDGVFDRTDLTSFATAYDLANPNRVTIPVARDFSRFDLNGDGYTGGIITTAFDLDVGAIDSSGHPTINTVNEQIEGYPITFNEAAVSDAQILCYYAYSSLYASDGGGPNDRARTSLLADVCVGAKITAVFPSQISVATTLNMTVAVPVGGGQFAPAANMRVELTPTCATVSPTNAQTDANGVAAATVTPSNGCTSVSVQAVARAAAGTAPLAQQVVTATVASAPQSVYAIVGIDQPSAGTLRASFAVPDQNGTPIDDAMFTEPVSNLAGFMSHVTSMLSGITEIGSLSIKLTDQNVGTVALDLGNVPVGQLAITSTCGSTVSVTVGDLRPNAAVNAFTTGVVGVGACGTVNLTARTLSSVAIANSSNLTASITATSVSNVVDMRNGLTSSTLDLNTGPTRFLNVLATSSSTVSFRGTVIQGMALQGNQSLTLGTPINSNGLTGDIAVNSNSFAGPAPLSQLQIGNVAGNLTITNNGGFTNADAQSFAGQRTVGGTTTITGNHL